MSNPTAKVPPWSRVTTVRDEIASVLASWRAWASNEIEASGGDPASYEQILRGEDQLIRPQKRKRDRGGIFVASPQRPAARLLVQLHRIGLQLDRLDHCEMSNEARDLALRTVGNALWAFHDVRQLELTRNGIAIAKHLNQVVGASRFQAKKQSFNSWLQEQADAIRQQRSGIYDTTIEKILLKRPEVKAARKGRGYKSGRIRRIIAKK
jgi:hypothetical protein